MFEPPYSTLHVSAMQGGNAPNIIAKDARLHWELRNLPSDPPDAVRARFDDFTAQLARDYVARAIKCLDAIPASEYRDALVELSEFAVARTH